MSIFTVDSLHLHYLTRFGEKVRAVSGVSFALKEGEILGLAGESGCGKSTLVNGCMGLFIPPLCHGEGDVRVDGVSLLNRPTEDIRRNVLGRQVSIIPQGAFNALNPTRRIGDTAADMIASHDDSFSSKEELKKRLWERFRLIGIDPAAVLDRYPVELTAGTRQRCVLAVSTLLNPKVVIADEPTSALDVTTQKAVIRMIFDLLDKKIFSSMIFITHELPLLRHVAHRIAVMYAGEIVEYGTTQQIVFDPRHPYTQALMAAMLTAEPGQKQEKPRTIEGAPPNLARPISGCRFAPRCPVRRDDCLSTDQHLRNVAGREVRCAYAV